MAKSKAKAKAKKKIEANEVKIGNKFPMTLIFSGVAILIVAIVVALVLINPSAPNEGRVIETPETESEQTPEKVVETTAKEILAFMSKQDAYSGWEYSGTEPYLIATKGVSDGARVSMCTGVDECKVQWWGIPIKAAKVMVTLSRFHEVNGAKAYYNSLYKVGKSIENDCIVYNDYTVLCRKHNFVFTMDSQYGSNYDGNLLPAVQDLALNVYREIDYWN